MAAPEILTEAEDPDWNYGGIRIDRGKLGDQFIYRFETSEGFFLMSEQEIKQKIRDRN